MNNRNNAFENEKVEKKKKFLRASPIEHLIRTLD